MTKLIIPRARVWLASLMLIALLSLPVACSVIDALHSFDPPSSSPHSGAFGWRRPGMLVAPRSPPLFPY